MPEELAKLSLGADPEFIIVKNGKPVPARNVLGRNTSGKIGTDGCDNLGEMRPHWKWTPDDLTREIQRCFNLANSTELKGKYHIWSGSGTGNYTIGGHIHFGWGRRTSPRDLWEIGEVLDIASIFLQRGYDAASYHNRTNNCYGELALEHGRAIQTNGHGFEYRTPPSWLFSPEITSGILWIYYILAWEYIYNREGKVMKALEAFRKAGFKGKARADYKAFATTSPRYKKVYKTLPAALEQSALWKSAEAKVKPVIDNLEAGKKFAEHDDVLKAWVNVEAGATLIGDSVFLYRSVIFNRNDAFMREIRTLFGRRRNVVRPQDIIGCYGLAENRPMDVLCYGESVFEHASRYNIENGLGWNVVMANRAVCSENNLPLKMGGFEKCIGFHARIRANLDNRPNIAGMLRYVQKKTWARVPAEFRPKKRDQYADAVVRDSWREVANMGG